MGLGFRVWGSRVLVLLCLKSECLASSSLEIANLPAYQSIALAMAERTIPIAVNLLSGEHVCDIVAAHTWTVRRVKEAIDHKLDGAGTSPLTRRAVKMNLCIKEQLFPDRALLGDVVAASAGVEVLQTTLVASGRYDGTYKAEVPYNGSFLFQISSSSVQMLHGEIYPEEASEIHWDKVDPKKCSFTVFKRGTSEWAQIKTHKKHTDEEGLRETFEIEFLGDEKEYGFIGKFQRTYEGPLGIARGTCIDE
ncbi:unnamed protein product [Symbiodinium natans]|uniref:Uncharacterized protein n=1 Tax=Symbiodinium natans TaxID=878477 RepID=A0A812P777_9DINO|nr:unnamed protein product [Symbiodinium natans]